MFSWYDPLVIGASCITFEFYTIQVKFIYLPMNSIFVRQVYNYTIFATTLNSMKSMYYYNKNVRVNLSYISKQASQTGMRPGKKERKKEKRFGTRHDGIGPTGKRPSLFAKILK